MTLKLKHLWVKVMLLLSKVCGWIGNTFIKLHIKAAIKAEDLNAKWSYLQAYVIGSEQEISDSIREGSNLPVRKVAVVDDGGEYYLIYDYTIHRVINVSHNRVYKTEAEAFEAVKGFITTRNFAKVTVDEATESATVGQNFNVVSEVVQVVPAPKKGNGKRHIEHNKKDNKKQLKKGNGNFKKQPKPKHKVVKKLSK